MKIAANLALVAVALVVAYVLVGGLVGTIASLIVPAICVFLGWKGRELTLPSAARRELGR